MGERMWWAVRNLGCGLRLASVTDAAAVDSRRGCKGCDGGAVLALLSALG